MGVALVVAACSDSGMVSSPTVSTTPPTTASGSTTTTLLALEAVSSYEECLADNGVSIEPIPYDAAGRPRLELVMREVDLTDEDNIQALTRCAPNLSSGALDMSDIPALEQDVNDLLSEFSVCLRDHGVESFPDPVAHFSGVGGPYPLAEIPYEDPDLGDAVDVCGEKLG
jgi:hypothetical protein